MTLSAVAQHEEEVRPSQQAKRSEDGHFPPAERGQTSVGQEPQMQGSVPSFPGSLPQETGESLQGSRGGGWLLLGA